jgi:hypothetical protein
MCRTGLIRSLLNESEIKNFMKHCWKERLGRLKENDKIQKEYKTKNLPAHLCISNLCITTKYAFGFLDNYVWKIELKEEISKMNFSLKNSNEIAEDCESWYFDDDVKINKETYETYDCLKIHNLVDDPYMDAIRALFQEVISNYTYEDKLELAQNLIKWEIKVKRNRYNHDEIELQVFKKINDNSEWKLICRTFKNPDFYAEKLYICGIKLFNDNNIIILTTRVLLIYHYNENNKSIFLNYYYEMDLNPVEKRIDKLRDYEKVFSKPTLPLPNFNNYSLRSHLLASLEKDNEKWFLKYGVELLLYAIEINKDLIDDICRMCINYDNKEMMLKYVVELYSFVIKERGKNRDKDGKYTTRSKSLIINIYKRCIDYDSKEFILKYGVQLLTSTIEERKLELIDGIYKRCINYFREEPENNRMFLSIIVSMMPLLSEYYPEYISRYSLETTMIIDFPYYIIKHQDNNLHLCSLQYPQFVNTPKFSLLFLLLKSKTQEYNVLINCILYLIIIILVLISLPLVLISLSFYYIHFAIRALVIYIYFYFKYYFKTFITTPTITFMIPYIKFVNYPNDYKWYLELIKPQPSLFVKLLNIDIYKTWDGEALINFKWNTYGKYYYAMIWIGFMALLGCFTVAATIPKQYIDKDVQKQLLIASIIFGFVHLSFEVRQMVYDFNKWIRDFWNIFGKYKIN